VVNIYKVSSTNKVSNTKGTNKMNKIIAKLIFALVVIDTIFFALIYSLDKLIMPTVINVANAEMRGKALEIINKSILNEYSKQFNYDEIVKFDKDKEGNIVMFKADTLRMNKIACDVAINSQEELQRIGVVGIKVPMGYIFKNNLLAYIGPEVTVKMQPIGSIETKYISEFESAGINQTRHKIYVLVKTQIRVVVPFDSDNLEVQNEVPIAETVIVGKVPNTAVNFDLKDAGFKLDNK
jgi:sporulation protein YunB